MCTLRCLFYDRTDRLYQTDRTDDRSDQSDRTDDRSDPSDTADLSDHNIIILPTCNPHTAHHTTWKGTPP